MPKKVVEVEVERKEGNKLSDHLSVMRASLSSLSRAGSVAVLPDYFVDRFVKINSIDDLTRDIKTKSLEGGGGSLRGISQLEVKGGNAVNLAYALGKFGARVNLLAIAESLNAETLKSIFQKMPNVKLHIVPGKNGFTIALEFFEHGRHVNIMLSDVGDLRDFDGSAAPKNAWDDVSGSKIVSVVNWGANKKGTELCLKAFSLARERGARSFLDPADIAERSDALPNLKREIFDRGLLDYMSMNDNELRIMCRTLCNYQLPYDYSEGDLRKAVQLISEQSNSIIDLHTRNMSLSCASGEWCYLVHCHKVDQKIVTGAGDVWDAADLVGHLLNWEPEARLEFANAAGGFYVSRENAESPTLDEVLQFVEGHAEYYH